MNRKLIILLIGILFLTCSSAVIGKTAFASRLILQQSKCSPEIEGLKFCTSSTFVSVKSGGNVAVKLSLQNMTEKSISIINDNYNSPYKIIVTDQNINRIPSFTELLEKKQKAGTITPKALGELLPISSSPAAIKSLAPQQELKTEYNLSQFYDFKMKGTYDVEISRKISKQNGKDTTEISFRTIKVEVK